MRPSPPEIHPFVLATKFAPPRPPAALVARDTLLAALDGALGQRLTLVSASAGWGKTTLLSAWASRLPHPVAWLSLDELDDDPARQIDCLQAFPVRLLRPYGRGGSGCGRRVPRRPAPFPRRGGKGWGWGAIPLSTPVR